MRIAWYASGHGFGHISRSSVIIDGLIERGLVTGLALMSSRCGFIKDHPLLLKRTVSTDVGMIQNTSIDMDLDATAAAIHNFMDGYAGLADSETLFLEGFRPDLIVSDVSSFPLGLAHQLGIPSVLIGNFTWDFIYRHYQSQNKLFGEYAAQLEDEYARAGKKLVLPFHCGISESPANRYTGLIGRKPRMNKKESREYFNFKPGNIYILLSFGAYGLGGREIDTASLPGHVFLVSSGLDTLPSDKLLHFDGVWYPDLVTACDYVMTKPGYGILSECYFAGTPVVYTDRGDFPEYNCLVESLNTYFISHYLGQEDLFAMNLPFLEKRIEQQRGAVLEDGLDEMLAEITGSIKR